MFKGVFITGTDTEAGKTYIACALVRALRNEKIDVGVMKPIASGSREDARKLISSAGIQEPLGRVNPVYLRHPLAPYVSAQLSGKKIELCSIRENYEYFLDKYTFTVVEGIGGLLVPIRKNYMVVDMIRDFSLPVVIVAVPGLGTINHTLLTVNELKKNKVRITGIILSGRKSMALAQRTNPAIIRKLTGLPLLEVPYGKGIDLRRNRWLIGGD